MSGWRLCSEFCRLMLCRFCSSPQSPSVGVADRPPPPPPRAAVGRSLPNEPTGSALYCANADRREEPRRDGWSGGSSAGRGWLTERSVAASAAAASSSAAVSAAAERAGPRLRRWPRTVASPLPERPARGAPPLLDAGRLVLLEWWPEPLPTAACAKPAAGPFAAAAFFFACRLLHRQQSHPSALFLLLHLEQQYTYL